MKVVVVDPERARQENTLAWLAEAGHQVDAFDELDPGATMPRTDLLVVAGPDVPELCVAFSRTRRARWIVALVPPEQVRVALEAGAQDCLLPPLTREALEVRLRVATASGALAPDLPPSPSQAPSHEPPGVSLPGVDALALRRVLDVMPAPVGLVDRDGRFVQCNRELERAFYQPLGSMIGHQLEEFFVAEDVQDLREEIVEEGIIHNKELRLRHTDGNTYWVSGSARWISGGYAVGTFTDITERRLTEEALRQSETSLHSVLEASPDGIIVHSEGRFLYINPTAVRQFGYDDATELMHTSIYDRIHPSELESVQTRVEEMLASGQPATNRDIEFTRRDDATFVGEVASIPAIFDGQRAIISLIRDVGEQRRLQGQLFLADRLATVGTLAVGVAHEINNPLSWVVGNLGLLADEFDNQVRMREDPNHDPEFVARSRARVRDLLARAQEGTERVRRIVRDLTRFARSDAMEDEVVDLHALLDSTLEIAEVQIRHRARLTREFRAANTVRGSEGRLGQVFLNLLVNAGQAIEPGRPRDNRVHVATRGLPDGRVEVEVSDTGCGIPQSKLGRIFDPFFTTKAAGEGTGIGLAISHNIVNAHGGELLVESKVGQGTTFRVRLPAAEVHDPSRPARIVRTPSANAEGRHARVLVADDEPLIREMVCDALSAHEVAAVSTGRAALDRLLNEDWDLILCDLFMPELTGIELWERISEERPEICQRLVFMTGGDLSGHEQRFPDGVEVRWLEKPFSIRSLRELAAAAAAS
ncbi:PAS domain S-box protein [Pseudenhygromyxa sp. WMMC2535]|uniref:ATP-binding protein n=1 Tax=Pseudenhygromyxa sp. WMMC2535 TaxID=2712867 RepID=UPI001555F959|nr:ATP-binding protein [Pseudenhygromyxa sp. WMMC2535]NVB39730.1 PAS domain S-box protein [Pseudenhygromyxa sp. WMMC2535]